MTIIKNIFKILTIILVFTAFNSCTSLMALAGSERANEELLERTIEDIKNPLYCSRYNYIYRRMLILKIWEYHLNRIPKVMTILLKPKQFLF